MMLFGHIGLTYGAVKVCEPKINDIDYRKIAAVSILPDLIDKPLRYFIAPDFCQGNTRTIGHSLTLSVLFAMALYLATVKRKPKLALVYVVVLLMHLVLDQMWHPKMRISVLWPWAGNNFPKLVESGVMEHLARNYSHLAVILGDIAGFVILLGLFLKYRLYQLPNLKAFLRTGYFK